MAANPTVVIGAPQEKNTISEDAQVIPNDPASELVAATKGFDLLFANELEAARTQLARAESPFHLLGRGVCAFLEAALGMETDLMGEAARCLAESEAGAKRRAKEVRNQHSSGKNDRFPPALEYEILQADAVVLQGLVHALSESYMGYAQCLYALNSAHSRFTKLYKNIFPNGLDAYVTPAASPLPSRMPSATSVNLAVPATSVSASASAVSLVSTSSANTVPATPPPSAPPRGGSFFSKIGLGLGGAAQRQEPPSLKPAVQPEGPVEELIVSGAAFGFGIFNLVFSLLPGKVKGVVGFLGFQHDRRSALQALAVSAARTDVHSVFAGLVLMSYYGVVLLMSGFQADEKHIDKQYRAIVESVSSKYPNGALWILNRAKIARMTYDPEESIRILREGLRPDRPGRFLQADALLLFELAWTLLSQRRYQEAADMFMRMTEVNSWSHATYCTIAGGCYVSLGNREKAKELFDRVPKLLDKRKIGGKDLPTEVFIRKKLAFYKAAAKRRGADESAYVDFINISPAEELGIFWNTHQRITREVAIAHINELYNLTPTPARSSPFVPPDSASSTNPSQSGPQLDTPDDLAIRSLLLGILHRTLRDFAGARVFLNEALAKHDAVSVSKWVGGVALFELAVEDCKEMEAREQGLEAIWSDSSAASDSASQPSVAAKPSQEEWSRAMKEASVKLEKAMSISGSSVDLSSRLDTRVNMLKDEIAMKREMLGIR